jgi:hypothetical protein
VLLFSLNDAGPHSSAQWPCYEDPVATDNSMFLKKIFAWFLQRRSFFENDFTCISSLRGFANGFCVLAKLGQSYLKIYSKICYRIAVAYLIILRRVNKIITG